MKPGRLSFLDEGLIKTMVDGKQHMLSICDILAKLSVGDSIESFCSLRPHQRHAFYAFLVQVAAISMNKTHEVKKPDSAAGWRKLILNVKTDANIWDLISDEVSLPALLQSPIPEREQKSWDKKAKRVDCPDLIDILINSKNHDIKKCALYNNRPEHWFFALLTLQTTGGYSGSRNYGISRMNGGLGNRPCVTRIPSLSWGERFRRDLAVLLENRPELVDRYGYERAGGEAFLWALEWGGAEDEMLTLNELDPYYIEVCRRIRLREEEIPVEPGWRIVAQKGSSAARRIDAAAYKGMVGDPWTPTVLKDGKPEKSLTLSWPGFDFRILSRLLFEEGVEASLLQRPHALDGKAPKLLVSTLVRGQGETEGYHQRFLPIPEEFFSKIDKTDSRWNSLSRMAADRIENASFVLKKILHPALALAMQGAPNKIDLGDKRILGWKQQADKRIDEAFFPSLWADAKLSEEEAYVSWVSTIIGITEEVFFQAITEMPFSSASRYKSMASGNNFFQGSARQNYPELYNREKEDWKKVQDLEIKKMPYQDVLDEEINNLGLKIKKLKKYQLRDLRNALRFQDGSNETLQAIKEKCLKETRTPGNERKLDAIISGMAILGHLNERFKYVGYMMGLAQYPERRVLALLEAKGEGLWRMTQVLARFLADKGHGVSWVDIARIILDEEDIKNRLKMASSYYYEMDKKRKEKAKKEDKDEEESSRKNKKSSTGKRSSVHRASQLDELCGGAAQPR